MTSSSDCPPVVITGLTLYPVKAMKGISVENALLEPEGLAHDRRFMVVREDGRFVTQRDMPRLALIHTALLGEGIRLSLQGHGSVMLPFDRLDGQTIETAVWGEPCTTIDQGSEASRWLSETLQSKEPLSVVRMAAGFTRPQSKPELLGRETHTHFADAAPLLVANEASLEALNAELVRQKENPVPMNRFRPNITVRGLDAFTEHQTAALAGPGYRLRMCHPCQRCKVTTIDQDSAESHPHWQPYKTLAAMNPMPGSKRAPAFGQNAVIENGDGARVSLGDRLKTTEA